MTTIRQLHAGWAARIVPPNASPIQRQEMERAFYSGALTLFRVMVDEVTALPDEAAAKAMTRLEHELTDYFRLLVKIPGTHGTEKQ